MSKILLVGSANMDLSMNVFRVPNAGETLIDDGGVAYTPGGKGANSAIALQKLGGECIFCTRLGADAHGQRLFTYYKELGLDTSAIRVDHDAPTGLAVVMKESDGQNRIVVYPGANKNLTAEHVNDAFNCNPDAVYVNFEIPFSIASAVIRAASKRGIPVFVDAAPASKEYDFSMLPEVEVFSPNETETELYTGILPQGYDSALRASLVLSRMVKAKYIIIKQGARGAFLYDGKHNKVVPAYHADHVIDTTAAGDTFTAAMTVEYLRNGGNIHSAVQYGCAAGAISVSRAGASASVPTDAEVRAFMQTHRSY